MECPICYTDYDKSNMVRTICNHTFHHKCLKIWLLSDEQGTCPCCRFQFKTRHNTYIDKNEKDDNTKNELTTKITNFDDKLIYIENNIMNKNDKYIEKIKLFIHIFNYLCEEKEHLYVLGKHFIYALHMKLIDLDKETKSKSELEDDSFSILKSKSFQKKLNKYKKKLRKHFEWANETDFQYEMEN